MKEYVAAVIKAREEHDAAHAEETEARKQAIKSGDSEDPVVHLLEATCQAARAQAERTVDTFLKKIKETLHKHVPVTAPNSKHHEHSLSVPNEHVADGGR